MKCDELNEKIQITNDTRMVYLKSLVDAAIAELKDENERITIDKRNAELRADVADATVEKLKAENAELKAKLESVQATAYADSVDAGMENRKLKRALWLARGYIMTLLQIDFQRLAYQCNNDDYKGNLLRRRNRYYDLSEKCRAKAEEYR